VAWSTLDKDGSGEIDLNEWIEVCEEIGFFGETVPIFRYLDSDDEGTISRDEFEFLTSFQRRRARSFVSK